MAGRESVGHPEVCGIVGWGPQTIMWPLSPELELVAESALLTAKACGKGLTAAC